jgi:hypothetical protein
VKRSCSNTMNEDEENGQQADQKFWMMLWHHIARLRTPGACPRGADK